MNVGTAVFRAIADFSGVVNEADRSADALDRLGGEGERTQGRFSRFVGGVARGAALAAGAIGAIFSAKAIGAGLDRLQTIQDSTTALTVQFGSAEKAASLMTDILGVVTGTPFNLDQFAAAGAQLAGYGVDATKIPGYLTAIGEASARMGKDAPEAADRLSTAFGRIASQGRLGMEEVNTFSDVGVNALMILGNAYGVSADEARDMVSKGLIPAAEAMDILADGVMNGSTGIAGSAAALKGTMEGLRQNLSGARGGFSAAIARFGATVIGPFTGLLTQGFTTGAGVLDVFGAKAAAVLTRVAESPGFQRFLDWLVVLPDRVGALLDSVGVLAGRAQGLWASFTGNAAVESSMSRLSGIFTTLSGVATDLMPSISGIAGSLGAASAAVGFSVWSLLLSTLQILADLLAVTLVPALDWLSGFMTKHQGLVTAVVGAYTIWRLAMLGLAAGNAIIAVLSGLQAGYAAATYGAAGATYAQTIAQKAGLIAGKAVMVATKLWAAAQWLLNAAMSANPIGLVIAAVALLIAAFVWAWNNIDGFAEFFVGIWEWIKDAWSAAGEWFGNLWGSIIGFFEAAGEVVQRIGQWFGDVWQSIMDGWSAAIGFFEGIRDAIIGFFQAVWDFVLTVWSWTPIGLIVTNWDAIVAWFGGLWTRVVAIFQGVWDFLLRVWSWTPIGMIVTNWNTIVAFFSTVWQRVVAFFQAIKDGIVEKFTAAVDWARGIGQRVLDAIGDLGQLLYNAGAAVITGLWEGMKSIWTNVSDWIGDVGTSISNGFMSVLGIGSPSKVFASHGADIMLGIGVGIAEEMPSLRASMADVVDAIDINQVLDYNAPINTGLDALSASLPGLTSQPFNQALAGTTSDSSVSIGSLTVNNPRPERAGDSLARQVRKVSAIGVR